VTTKVGKPSAIGQPTRPTQYRGTMRVNQCEPKTVIRLRRDCDLNPGPSAPESSTLTTRLPSHPVLQCPKYLIFSSPVVCRGLCCGLLWFSDGPAARSVVVISNSSSRLYRKKRLLRRGFFLFTLFGSDAVGWRPLMAADEAGRGRRRKLLLGPGAQAPPPLL